ncbi:ribonuclease domain-containing protein [Tsukamurella sp. 8F]|uniref:ribonuclease domain-containing protein n=1 Tax=unclassified Tsukamurella TaxID=2633480 RepID=UPI0023B8883C|nr:MULTISPECIES: ribonuclease domain-containing protein [unclassified Tsukamurella]MDF0531831.1 ribonuclease domain-containing protein [Tsukamurella sp. 8J]MDF0589091.1 ribonuclease domain-containing protein [Tsukamurella sp. 8F]
MRRIVTSSTGLLLTLLLAIGLGACSKEPATPHTAATAASNVAAGSVSPGSASVEPKPGGAVSGGVNSKGVPQRVLDTLARIDAGTWPPHDGSGTHGGTTFGNREGRLPSTVDGKRVSYKEWDVSVKKRGSTRDAERIITGSDHSAWYTLDHYKTFKRLR